MPRLRSAVLLAVAAAFLATTAGADNRALIVGVGKYQHPGADLPGIDKDVNAMKDAVKLMGFTDSQIKVLLDDQATLANIRSQFEGWLTQAGPQDKALFYFSGHGTGIKDQNGDEKDGVDEVVLPHDFKVENRTIVGSLVDDDLGALVDKLKTRNTYLFIDSCHSGTVTREVNPGPEVAKFFQYEGMPKSEDGALDDPGDSKGPEGENHLLMTAATEKEQARATPEGSVFTLGVLQEIRAASGAHKPATPVQVREAAERYINSRLPEGKRHTPTLYGNEGLKAANLFAPASAGGGGGGGGGSTGGENGKVWAEFEKGVAGASYPVKVSARQQTYKEGENLVIDVDVTEIGYLHVINVGSGDATATLLFPNQHRKDNQVTPGRVTVPGPSDPFTLPAGLPAGRSEQPTLIVVVHTKEKLNLYEQGKGTELFEELDQAEATRAFTVAAAKPSAAAGARAYGAGKAVVTIKK